MYFAKILLTFLYSFFAKGVRVWILSNWLYLTETVILQCSLMFYSNSLIFLCFDVTFRDSGIKMIN